MRLIIVGLRRSGTTAFWRTWRQDARFVCYNEPFSQEVVHVCDPGWRDLPYTGRELHDLWERAPRVFWDMFQVIYRREEPQTGMSDRQRRYLAWLMESAEHVCIDLTRCHFKIEDLRQVAQDAVLIHLYRPPPNWLTSIVLPSSTKLKRIRERRLRIWRQFTRATRNALNKRHFWTAERGFGYKGYEEIIGTCPQSLFGYRLREVGLDPENVYGMPLAGRLLSLWRVYGKRVEADGRGCFGERFLSVNFNTFCRDPESIVTQVYERLGAPSPPFDFSSIHPPRPPFSPAAPGWKQYFEQLGIDQAFSLRASGSYEWTL